MADTQMGRVFGSRIQPPIEDADLRSERRALRDQIPVHLLVMDNDSEVRKVCQSVGEQCGLKVMGVGSEQEALNIMEMSSVDVLLTDLSVPGASGLDLLRKVMITYPDIAVVMLTQNGTMDYAVEATRLGAADYVTKPFRVEELRARLEQVTRAVELRRENRVLREQLRTAPGFGGLVGTSSRMQRVYRMIEKVSQREHPVLILGESGTGKELVARSIHFSGPRKNKPFVPVDCSSLVPTLIESELFGYTKGAFTGAIKPNKV